MPQALPAIPNLDWLKKTARQRLVGLRAGRPEAKLHEAQLALARDYGFKSWRALKSHVERITPAFRDRASVFDAARSGDVEAVRRAFASGFDPATPDTDGRTVHQIAKELRHEAIEVLTRTIQGGKTRPDDEMQAIQSIMRAAQSGDLDTLRAGLDAHSEWIDALGGGFEKATALHLAVLRNQHAAIRLLIKRGADLDRREFPDNAAPLHFAALHGDMETIRLLVEAGADIHGNGDDHGVGVLGWATCFGDVRREAADYLLAQGAKLNLWTAIALDRAGELRAMIAEDRSLLSARMTRNQHRCTPLHHAVRKNRPSIVQLLLELGADPNARDATGATALTTAAETGADARIVAALSAAGLKPDLLTLLNTGRYAEAEAMLRDDPSRIGPGGSNTMALHVAVHKRNLAAIRWLLAHGVDVNARRPMWDINHTALHMAIESGAIEIVRLLLDAGADPNIRDGMHHATALGWAEFFGRDEMAELIRGKGGLR
ncbi:ankyrin repeat domain-containing protein [uncultured Bradyrhizobium sp.]|uniref:ankyrin repeat domain-containing protein n=1 Tax=uncultured Bradyrhizobium sp. TaxID=199684 RepID=UPI0035CB4707